MMEKVKEERSPMKKKKQQRKRGIAEEIQVSILSKVVIVFVIVAAVVTFMVGNISLSAQKNDLEMQSKAAAYQLEIFFEEYTTVAEQMCRLYWRRPDRELILQSQSVMQPYSIL